MPLFQNGVVGGGGGGGGGGFGDIAACGLSP